MSLYDTDFVAWAESQAELLRERRFEALDLEQLIQEVEDLAGNYQDALQSQMQRLLTHLLKLAYTQGSSDPARLWKLSVQDARNQIQKHLHRHPSLNARLQGEFEFSYPYAVKDAHHQLAIYNDTHTPFPEACPWSVEQVLDEGFWPEGIHDEV